jgi:hypothetical protein
MTFIEYQKPDREGNLTPRSTQPSLTVALLTPENNGQRHAASKPKQKGGPQPASSAFECDYRYGRLRVAGLVVVFSACTFC